MTVIWIISILALREESDLSDINTYQSDQLTISIHALREESDGTTNDNDYLRDNFNPRSP